MNRKGLLGTQTMLVVFVFCLVLILLGISGGIYLFYGKGYDFRTNEAGLLNYKISACISDKNVDFAKDDFYKICTLNKEVIEKNNKIKICKNPKSSGCVGEDKPEFMLGGTDDFVPCGFEGKNENAAKCAFGILLKGSDVYEIITTSSQNSGGFMG
jgi:hypothetical protein